MGFSERAAALRPGMAIGNKANSPDFWALLYGRPTAFLLLVVVGDWKWVTPNLLTATSTLLLGGACAAIAQQTPTMYALAAVALSLSQTFDCADGQLARYRGAGSELGSYHDKASDAIGLIAMFGTIGWVAFEQYGEPYLWLFALLAVGSQLTTGYVKWVAMAALHRARRPPPPATDRHVPWYEYPHRLFLMAFRFSEPDLYFWIALACVLDRFDLLLWLCALTQPAIALGAIVARGLQVAALDRSADDRPTGS